MKRINRFHFIAVEVDLPINYSVFRTMYNTFRQKNEQTSLKILGYQKELDGIYKWCSTISIFKPRKKHACESCGKTIEPKKYCFGILHDYHCLVPYWGYNFHLCLSCVCKNVGNVKIVECDKFMCSFENMKDHRTMMLFDLLTEQFGFKIVESNELQSSKLKVQEE